MAPEIPSGSPAANSPPSPGQPAALETRKGCKLETRKPIESLSKMYPLTEKLRKVDFNFIKTDEQLITSYKYRQAATLGGALKLAFDIYFKRLSPTATPNSREFVAATLARAVDAGFNVNRVMEGDSFNIQNSTLYYARLGGETYQIALFDPTGGEKLPANYARRETIDKTQRAWKGVIEGDINVDEILKLLDVDKTNILHDIMLYRGILSNRKNRKALWDEMAAQVPPFSEQIKVNGASRLKKKLEQDPKFFENGYAETPLHYLALIEFIRRRGVQEILKGLGCDEKGENLNLGQVEATFAPAREPDANAKAAAADPTEEEEEQKPEEEKTKKLTWEEKKKLRYGTDRASVEWKLRGFGEITNERYDRASQKTFYKVLLTTPDGQVEGEIVPENNNDFRVMIRFSDGTIFDKILFYGHEFRDAVKTEMKRLGDSRKLVAELLSGKSKLLLMPEGYSKTLLQREFDKKPAYSVGKLSSGGTSVLENLIVTQYPDEKGLYHGVLEKGGKIVKQVSHENVITLINKLVNNE